MHTKHLTTTSSRLAAALLAFAALCAPVAIAQSAHVMENPTAAKWGPAPPMLPPGAQIAVLAGNPTASGPYTVRLKFPANYDIPAHSHPTDENVTVVSGAVFFGMGDRLDRNSGQPLGVGGFAMMPAGMNHYAFTKQPATIVLHGIGPVEFKYVNPADDPRNAKKTASK